MRSSNEASPRKTGFASDVVKTVGKPGVPVRDEAPVTLKTVPGASAVSMSGAERSVRPAEERTRLCALTVQGAPTPSSTSPAVFSPSTV